MKKDGTPDEVVLKVQADIAENCDQNLELSLDESARPATSYRRPSNREQILLQSYGIYWPYIIAN